MKKRVLLFLFILRFPLLIFGQCPPVYTVTSDTVCPGGSVNLLASGCSACDYQWFADSNGIQAIGTGSSGSSTVSIPINGDTVFYLYVSDPVNGCDNTIPPNNTAIPPVNVVVSGNPPGDTSIYGSWQWNAYCFSGTQLDSYKGYYIDNSFNVNSKNVWDSMYSPSYNGPTYYDPNTNISVIAPGYQGCDIPYDNHSIYYKRKGFPPGYYQLYVRHDDDGLIYVNKEMIYAKTYPGEGYVWQGYLDSNSTVDFIWNDSWWTSIGILTFTPVASPNLSARGLESDQVICSGGNPNPISLGKKISPSDDAFVFYSEPDSTHGHHDDIDTRECSNCGSNSLPDTQWVYIKFNLVGITNVNSAILNIAANNYYNNPAFYPGYPAYIYAVADTTWSENTLTWNNKPPFGTLLGSCLIIDDNLRYYKWDLTNYVHSKFLSGERKVSFMIRVTVDNTVTIHFRSKDDKSFNSYPYLEVNGVYDTCSTVSYQWQSQTGCSGSFSDIAGATSTTYNPPANPTSNTCYRLFASDRCNSAYSDTVMVTVSNPVTPTVTSGGRCGTGAISLTAGGGVGTFKWYDASVGGFQVGTGQVFTKTLSTTDSFFVSLQDSYGCEGNRAKAIATVYTPTVAGSLSSAANPVCVTSNSGVIHLSGYSGAVSEWLTSTDNFATLSHTVSNKDSISFTNIIATTSYKAVVQSGVCAADTTTAYTVTVSSASLGGNVNISSYDVQGGVLTLSGYLGSIIRWEYSEDSTFSTYSVINETSANLNFSRNHTTYYRALVQLGVCSGIYSKIIRVDAIVVYSAVSPNGDGYNDTWVIEGIEEYPENKVMIFDRLGSLVYKEEGYDNQGRVWKGFSNVNLTLGNRLPEGTYFYQIEISGTKLKTGYVVLKRN